MMSEFHWDTDQNAKLKNDTNIANHHIIKGQWTPEEDRYLFVVFFGFGFSFSY